MVTKKQFKKTLNKKHKKFNLTKKNKKQYRTKTRLNKLKNVSSGGAQAPISPQVSKEIPKIVKELEKYNLRTIIEDEKENNKENNKVVKPQKEKSKIQKFFSMEKKNNKKKKNNKTNKKKKNNKNNKKKKNNKTNTFSIINYEDKLNLYNLIKEYIKNLYQGKDTRFYYSFIGADWENKFEQFLPETNNDKDNMFLIFDYFKKQMNSEDINISPEYMASIFLLSFMGVDLTLGVDLTFIYANKHSLTIGLISFFTYIKNNDIYKNYIVNRLNILRNNMVTILTLLNKKQLLEGVFREAGLQLHLNTFYLKNKIDDAINIHTLCTLIKNYIKYLFISENIHLDTTPNFEANSVAPFVKTFLSNLSIEDKQIMTSIFIYLKEVMVAVEITQMTPQNISVVITPNFFPNLQLKTINNARTSAEINKNYIPLFTYIEKETYTNDENGPIFNITQPQPLLRELSV
jgi:hypothetical protein